MALRSAAANTDLAGHVALLSLSVRYNEDSAEKREIHMKFEIKPVIERFPVTT